MSRQTARSIATAAITTVATVVVGRAIVERAGAGRSEEPTRAITVVGKPSNDNKTADDHSHGRQNVFDKLHGRHSMIGSGKKS
jgi:hypothetical protein